MINYPMTFAAIAIALSLLALLMALWAIISVEAQKKSTHQVAWVPVSEKDAQNPKEMEKLLNSAIEEEEYDLI